jgi:beta-lactam-binding protein with PASTA domain/serine/threonine protein kinase
VQSDRHARTGGDAVAGDPLTGRLLDRRYRVGSRIARGGMASVYEATDLRLDRTVAVKVMHPGLGDDDEFAARFVREARAAARLSHPNVVAVFDQGDDDGTVFLAMELVPGHTLRDLIRKESPMAPVRALALLEPVVSALAAAHRAGLIHRDIKPENVLIATDPHTGASTVKVADFGLAKAVSADTQHTATGGVLIGTVSYLAPELVVDGRADARADVYAVGVVLYELLTGAKPHEGESPIQVAYKHVHEDVPAPSLLAPGLPAYVDALVARATARDRGLRPADAAVLLHQLHRVTSALADGVVEDPELTTDLAPHLLHPDTGDLVERPDPHGDTASDPFDAEALALLMAPPSLPAGADDRTTAIDRPPHRPDRTAGGATAAPPPARPARPRRSRRGPLLLLLALLLAVGAGVGAWWLGWARYTATPSVLGLTSAAAERKVEAAGLDLAVTDEAYSETVRAGRILETDPGAGSRILEGGTVGVVLSLGKERYDVPTLRGLSEDAAQDRLLATELTFGKRLQKYSETVPEGTVIASDPPVGTTLRPGAAVDLVVSRGRRPIEVQDFTGKDADRAQTRLRAQGLEVSLGDEEYSDSVPEGAVISQSPREGTLFRGDTVELLVSKGPALVEVPGGLIASGVDAATERLEALGFEVDVQRASEYIGLGYVFKVDPGSGTMAPKGSTITLYLV